MKSNPVKSRSLYYYFSFQSTSRPLQVMAQTAKASISTKEAGENVSKEFLDQNNLLNERTSSFIFKALC